jgi:hypothetical protein
MKFVNSVKSLQQRVETLLEKHPRLRDSDEKLIANIWAQDIKTKNTGTSIDSMSGKEVLSMFANKALTNSETIRRTRQKVQEKNEKMRGSTWKMRHKEEVDTRQNINKV